MPERGVHRWPWADEASSVVQKDRPRQGRLSGAPGGSQRPMARALRWCHSALLRMRSRTTGATASCGRASPLSARSLAAVSVCPEAALWHERRAWRSLALHTHPENSCSQAAVPAQGPAAKLSRRGAHHSGRWHAAAARACQCPHVEQGKLGAGRGLGLCPLRW